MTKKEKLEYWRERLQQDENDYLPHIEKMDGREDIYNGRRDMTPIVDKQRPTECKNVCNLAFENINAEIDNNIPQPKVTPRRAEDWDRAKLIEDLVRSELDRLPMEELNDLMERMVPIQGGGFWLIEWDDSLGKFYRTGDNCVSILHPKMVIPQSGGWNLDDIDYFFIKQAMTKGAIKRAYGVDVRDERESEPDIRKDENTSDQLVTLYTVYYRDDDGQIGKFSWVNDNVIEDLEKYQMAKHKVCENCGKILPQSDDRIREMAPEENNDVDNAIGELDAELGIEEKPEKIYHPKAERGKVVCPYCGSDSIKMRVDDFEEFYEPMVTSRGIIIDGEHEGKDEDGRPVRIPTRVPAYVPDVYPIVLQRNITTWGQLLGESDIDKISDLQNAYNWYMKKIDDRLLGAGSVVVLPKTTHIEVDPRDNRVWRVDSAADAANVKTLDFTTDVSGFFQQMKNCYEEIRNILGITDSMQGRRDTTATSARAKEFSASQSAARLESKRMLKGAAWARMFEIIFKFTLAYAKEPRMIKTKDKEGNTIFRTFDRMDFLEQSETGAYFWDDDFIFSVDGSAPLASNRSAMWQECREFAAEGLLGNLMDPATLPTFWAMMEQLDYPIASFVRGSLEERLSAMQMPAMDAEETMIPARAEFVPPDVNGGRADYIN